MSRFTKETLYDLLPAVYRQRDEHEGKPLESLVEIVAEQIELLENDIDGLYNNWFIETCDPWIVPYIGNLLGVKGLHKSGKFASNQRSQIANTTMYRSTKGTLSILEQIAYDTTKWHVHAIEFFKRLNRTQYLNHIKPNVIYGINLRDEKILKSIDTPFDQAAHNIDVRSITSKRGYHNIQNLGFFFWRIKALPVLDAPAFRHDLNGRFFFSQTGHDMQLFNHPQPENEVSHITEEHHLPIPISISTLRDDLDKEDCKYYSDEPSITKKSITIRADGRVINSEDIMACDLSQWEEIQPKKGKVAIDPVLGRIHFSDNRIPKKVYVSYHYGFSSEIGGGFFKRDADNDNAQNNDDVDIKEYQISARKASPTTSKSINDAIAKMIGDNEKKAVLLIKDSEIYQESINILIPEDCEFLSIRAEEEQRPTILTDTPIIISGKNENSNVEFDGILVGGKDGISSSNSLMKISKNSKINRIDIKNCTFVPSYIMKKEKKDKVTPSIIVETDNDLLEMTIKNSIVGPIIGSETRARFTIKDSIIDGTKKSASIVGHKINLKNTTVFGPVTADFIEATNTIFNEIITVKRRQDGCVRFCYIPEGSRIPMPYHCQPNYPDGSLENIKNDIKLKVKPRFVSTLYGHSAYAQLHQSIAKEIFEGGDNESEIGVYNTLYQPQRLRNFIDSFDEYLRFGMQAGVFFVT